MVTESTRLSDMTDKELLTEANRIIDTFREYSARDPFGWDWPTLQLIFPKECSRYRDIAHEWHARHPQESS